MNPTRIAVIAALAAVAAWAFKALAIGLAGGLDQSPAEGPLFLLGLVCFVVAACSLALSVAGRRQWWARVAAVVGAVLAVLVGVAAASSLVDSLAPSDHWVWSELSLWLASLGLLAAGSWHAARRGAGSVPQAS